MNRLQKLLILPIRGYQYGLSPLMGTNCRFYPSCSHYMVEAIETHGAIKGVFLGTKRLLKCHPWHAGGLDPVPSAPNSPPTTSPKKERIP